MSSERVGGSEQGLRAEPSHSVRSPLVRFALSTLLFLVPALASAQDAVPPPSWARSIEVVDDGAVLYVAPRAGADRRGTVSEGTRLPFVRRLAGNGCSTGFWFQVDDQSFICAHDVRPSADPPRGETQPPMRGHALLPNTYAFVAFDGTRAYARPADYDADQYVEAYGEGFGLVLLRRAHYDGLTFFQTRRGLWVERGNLRFASGSSFRGVTLGPDDPLDIAFVRRNRARIYSRPRGRVVRRAGQRDVVHVAEEVGRAFVRLTDDTFMRKADLHRAVAVPRPEEVGPNEHWIDVDVEEQVMIAYEGDRAVFVTLVSTGRRRRTHRTPLGEHRIWVKLATSDMDDLERTDVERNYSIEAVPWVQYFEGSNGFHTAFWHDDFGRRRSHGCVNLSPADARWLFGFTEPALPDGWYAILPTDQDPGTLVRVR